MKIEDFKLSTSVFSILGIFLFIFVLAEAIWMPLTHDEYSTIGFSQESIIDIITYKNPIPNNHILNTLLLKVNISIFGDRLFTNRLFNILSFIPFYIFTVLLSGLISRDMFLRFTLVVMVTMQPFFMDFFSVSRGYCISLCFLMISLFYFARTLTNLTTKNLVLSLTTGALGVIASFTLLNYYIPLSFLLAIFIIKNYRINPATANVKIQLLIIGLIGALLASFCYLPFSRMMATDQFVYWGSNGFFKDTVVELLYSLRSGIQYFRWDKEVYAFVIVSLFIIIFLSGFYIWYRSKTRDTMYVYFSALFLLTLLYNNVQFYVAKVPFLNARTSLFFVPLASVCIIYAIKKIYEKKDWLGIMICVSLSIFGIQHFLRGANPKSNFEWYQDEHNYQVLKEINNVIMMENFSKPVKVNCHWIFHPSLSYHVSQKYNGLIELIPYHKEIQPTSDALFYYTTSDEKDQLGSKYKVISEYAWKTRVLLKLK